MTNSVFSYQPQKYVFVIFTLSGIYEKVEAVDFLCFTELVFIQVVVSKVTQSSAISSRLYLGLI